MVALGLGDVDRDDLAVLGERRAEAEPEVHRHADDERHVGLAQRRLARPRERQRVIGGHASARQAVEEDRDAALLGERLQRAARRGPSRGSCRP